MLLSVPEIRPVVVFFPFDDAKLRQLNLLCKLFLNFFVFLFYFFSF